MSKFKVGDKVIGNKSASQRYVITKEGYIGTVTAVCSDAVICLDDAFNVEVRRFDLYSSDHHSIHITCTDNKTTHAVKKVDGKIVARAKAECCPTDEFNFNVGAQLAFNRLVYGTDYHPSEVALKPEQPKQEPVKLYCVEDYSGFTTKGKVYEFTDGDIRFDDGYYRAGWFTDYADFVSHNRGIAPCLVPLVSRAAQVGEWVLVTSDCLDGTHENEVCQVIRLNQYTGNKPYLRTKKPTIYGYPEIEPCTLANHNQYLVLDGYKPELEYLNMKVICVAANTSCCFTTGKVYEVKNGVLNDNGGKFDYNPSTPAKTLEQLNVEQIPKFIEFKGE